MMMLERLVHRYSTSIYLQLSIDSAPIVGTVIVIPKPDLSDEERKSSIRCCITLQQRAVREQEPDLRYKQRTQRRNSSGEAQLELEKHIVIT
jgi:hypothetical protein